MQISPHDYMAEKKPVKEMMRLTKAYGKCTKFNLTPTKEKAIKPL